MKHLNNLACMLAMLTAGSMGFTACSSDDVVDGGNTNNGVAGKMVKTSFALNIPYGGKSGRMTVDNTQANNKFTHMNDMRMLAFEDASIDATKTSVKKIVLVNGSDGAFDKEDSNNRFIYRDVMIPVGTKGFLFYGKKEAGVAEEKSMDDKFTYGSIVEPTILTSDPNNTVTKDGIAVSGLNFNLHVIHGEVFDGNAIGSTAKVVADALNSVYIAKDANGKTWASCDAASADVAEKHAATLFAQFKTLTAGSAASAVAALESLKKGCGRDIANTSEENDILLAVAKACDAAITKIEGEANKFPNDLGLPDGAAKGKFNAAGEFEYANVGIPAATGDNPAGLDYTKVTYPASLNYYVNTPVKTSNKAIENLNTTDGWPTYDNWSNSSYEWKGWGEEVESNTRSIALKNVIQYAVASLQTNVSISTSTLKDNAKKVGNLLADQSINVSDNGFKLTGVLIGGQPSTVGYDYTPETATSPTFDYTVYDREMNVADNVITSSKSTTNYTLVLDNYQAPIGENQYPSVYVTLELENNTGVDFYGADGVVPNGSKFYLVGQLNPNTGGNIAANGNANNLNQVFKFDHKTVANMKIGAESLRKAYNTIPDLRSTQISLGLAVDLTWENGITFDVNL